MSQAGRGGCDGGLGSPPPCGPHGGTPVLSTLALRRFEFLSPWGGSILCFHHSIFMVTWEVKGDRQTWRFCWPGAGGEGVLAQPCCRPQGEPRERSLPQQLEGQTAPGAPAFPVSTSGSV